MKKNRCRFAFALCCMFTVVFLFGACGKGWEDDLELAKKTAAQSHKNILLVFTGEDWNEPSRDFKNSVLNTKEFLSAVRHEYVPVNIDFSQDEYAKTELPPDASERQKNEAQKIKIAYDTKDALSKLYNVQAYPAIYVTSPEGYVLANVPYQSTFTNPQSFLSALAEKKEEITKMVQLVQAVPGTEGMVRVKAIDALYEATDENYHSLLNDYIQEMPVLDPENKSGVLSKYELQIAYINAMEKIQQNDLFGAVTCFESICETGHLESIQKQEAYYYAAYILAATNSMEFGKMLDLLQEAYDVNPTSEYANRVLEAQDAVRLMAEQAVMFSEEMSQLGEVDALAGE